MPDDVEARAIVEAEAKAKAEAEALAKQAKGTEGAERARLLAELSECKSKIAELASWRSEQEEFFKAAEEVLAKEDQAAEEAARVEAEAKAKADADAKAKADAEAAAAKAKGKGKDEGKGPAPTGLGTARPRSRLRRFVFGRGGRE